MMLIHRKSIMRNQMVSPAFSNCRGPAASVWEIKDPLISPLSCSLSFPLSHPHPTPSPGLFKSVSVEFWSLFKLSLTETLYP